VKALKSVWKDYQQRNGLKDEEPADNLLTSIELVLDNHNQLVEMNRLPGENEVMFFPLICCLSIAQTLELSEGEY